MVKRREALTVHKALVRIADLIGWAEMATIAKRSERAVQNWGEPNTSAGIPFETAIEFDAAYLAAGGHGALLQTVYENQLKERAERRGRPLLRIALSMGRAAKEFGEAVAATARAIAPGATRDDKIAARVETAEAAEALHDMLHDLEAAISGEPESEAAS